MDAAVIDSIEWGLISLLCAGVAVVLAYALVVVVRQTAARRARRIDLRRRDRLFEAFSALDQRLMDLEIAGMPYLIARPDAARLRSGRLGVEVSPAVDRELTRAHDTMCSAIDEVRTCGHDVLADGATTQSLGRALDLLEGATHSRRALAGSYSVSESDNWLSGDGTMEQPWADAWDEVETTLVRDGGFTEGSREIAHAYVLASAGCGALANTLVGRDRLVGALLTESMGITRRRCTEGSTEGTTEDGAAGRGPDAVRD